jgi:hypothetical protein
LSRSVSQQDDASDLGALGLEKGRQKGQEGG